MKEKHICKSLKMAMCITLMCMAFIACGDSETGSLDDTESTDATGSTDVTESTKVALIISAGKQNGSSSEARKDGYDAEDFDSGDEIGLYVLSADDLQSAYIDEETCYNVRATYDGSSWTMDNDIFLTNGDAYVIAYYPYDSSIGHTLSTSNDETLLFDLTPSGSEQTDVLASEGVTVSSSSPKAKLSRSHVLTRITLTIELADDITTSGTLTSLALSGDELYSDVGLYIDANGSFQTYSLNTVDDLTLSLDKTLSTDEETIVDFLIPSESSATLTAELEIKDNNTYSTGLIPYDGAWAAGYQYTGTIILTTDDDTSGYVDGYYAVDLGLSVGWATMDVGANDVDEIGWYLQWGQLAEPEDGDYSTSKCSTYGVSLDDISGNVDYDTATYNWGGSWRMPTYYEYYELYKNCDFEYDEETYGIPGAKVTGPSGNFIFLPITGWYDIDSSFEDYGNQGMFWTSQSSSDTEAYHFYILYSSGKITAIYSNDHNRSRGHPVRAVCDIPEGNSVTLY